MSITIDPEISSRTLQDLATIAKATIDNETTAIQIIWLQVNSWIDITNRSIQTLNGLVSEALEEYQNQINQLSNGRMVTRSLRRQIDDLTNRSQPLRRAQAQILELTDRVAMLSQVILQEKGRFVIQNQLKDIKSSIKNIEETLASQPASYQEALVAIRINMQTMKDLIVSAIDKNILIEDLRNFLNAENSQLCLGDLSIVHELAQKYVEKFNRSPKDKSKFFQYVAAGSASREEIVYRIAIHLAVNFLDDTERRFLAVLLFRMIPVASVQNLEAAFLEAINYDIASPAMSDDAPALV